MNHLLKAGICIMFLLFSTPAVFTQEKELVVFYNVENFFDTEDDPLYRDEEFTAKGINKWDADRYQKKQRDIFKVLAAIGEWAPPALICLAEIENRKVAEELISQTPLSELDYNIVHYNSPDDRGMDVAMLYRESVFCYDTSFVVPVFLEDVQEFSRDILFVKGRLHGRPLCIVINHWPSRRGGIAASEKFRLQAAGLLMQQMKTLTDSETDLHLVITGDFNDEPHNESLKKLTEERTATNLQVLTYRYSEKVKGTLKYKGNWFTFDQFIVSANMLKEDAGLSVYQKKANIFEPGYLLKKEKTTMGYRPYRTYLGSYYAGGCSDHLPVYIELHIN